MALFAVADVHGFYDETKRALDEAGFFLSSENKLVVVGDALDRGKQVLETVDLLLSLHREGRLIYIFGNHEELLDKCLQDIAAGALAQIASGDSYHYRNGTWGTVLALSGLSVNEALLYPDELIRRVRATDYYTELLPTAVDFYETDKYIFCHGWIPLDIEIVDMTAVYHYNPRWREADGLEWHRARWRNGMEMCCNRGIREHGKTVVCGHVNAAWGHSHISGICPEHGDGAVSDPFYSEGIIAIDACTVRSGRVNCIKLQD
jgi:hypothetical protein